MRDNEEIQSVLKHIKQNEHERELETFRSELAGLLVLKHMLSYATLWAFVWGMVVLITRLLWGTSQEVLMWGILGLVPACVVAFVVSRRGLPSKESIRVMFDRRGECGGLLMSQDEVDVGRWEAHVPAPKRPGLRWHSGQAWGAFFFSLAFLGASFLAPEKLFAKPPKRILAIDQHAKQLSTQIKILKQEKILQAKEAAELQQKLEKIQKEALGREPAKTWQALDKLEARNKQSAEEAAQKSLSQTEQWTAIQKLARQLESAMKSGDPKALTKGMKKLSKMLSKALRGSRFNKHWPPSLLKALRKMKLGARHLKSIKRSAGMCKSSISAHLKRLMKAKMLSKAMMAMNKKLGGKGMSMMPGKGAGKGPGVGIGRGGDTAPRLWNKASSSKGAKFKEKVLPPAQVAQLEQSQVIKLSQSAPTANTTAKTTQTGAISGVRVSQTSSLRHRISPQYMGTVKRYFERKAKP